jgi:hypothetical protein
MFEIIFSKLSLLFNEASKKIENKRDRFTVQLRFIGQKIKDYCSFYYF